MSENEKRVPKRRFKEFENAEGWEERKLGEFGYFYYGKSAPKWSVTEDAKTPCVRYGELYTKHLEKIDKIYSYTNIPKDNLKFSTGKEVLVPRVGEDPLDFANCSWLSIPDVAIGEMISVYNTEQNPLFTAYMFNALLKYEFAKRVEGGNVSNLYYVYLEDIPVSFPSIDEQEKIATFLIDISNIITLHQHKLEKMKALKKAYLTELFPAEGERKPKQRFAGFTDDWEQRKVGDVIDGLYNGQTPSRFRDDFWNGNINWLSSGELNRSVVTTTSEKITVAGQDDANLRIVPKNTFVMAITGLEAAGTRGNCGILGIDTTLNQSCMAIFPNKKLLSTQFLFQWYKMVGEDYGIRFTQGTKQQSYNAEIIKNLDICLPKVEEQLKISELLSKLDNLINIHQHKLEKLQNIKRAYLNEMFI